MLVKKLLSQEMRIDQGHNSNADICKKAVGHEFIVAGGDSAEFYGRTAKTANIGIAFRHIHYPTIILGVEDRIRKPSDHLF